VQSVEVGDAPVAIAVGADVVWVANRADGAVSRVDPRRNAVVGTTRVGAEPVDLVAGLGAVWLVRQTEKGRPV
jgi:streptogramin lyase